MDDRINTHYGKRFICVAVFVTAVTSVSTSLAAGIVADASAPQTQQPVITETANGITQINIQTPNSSGVSRNKYQRFNVDKQGAILNNSAQHTQTQIGGWVQGNSFLAGGTAKIILNEVDSQNPSLLHGPVEIAGDRAQLVIANPAGISCDGCGFINAHRSTLTTGNAIFRNGSLSGFDVNQGHISISGQGMDDRGTDYSDIIARTVSVNAAIWANKLNITSGLNKVSHTNQVEETYLNDSDKPSVSIDIAELGGMYADTIHLIGTENGVGVRHAGKIEAETLVLDSDGKLTLKTGSVIEASTFEGSMTDLVTEVGSEVTATNLQISSVDELVNQGLLDGKLARITANSINNIATGAIYADDLILESEALQNQSQVSTDGELLAPVIAARQSLNIAGETLFNDEGAVIYSAGDASFGGEIGSELDVQGEMIQLINQGGLIEAQGNLSLSVLDLQNLNSELITDWQTDSVERIREVQPEAWPNKYDITRFPLIDNHNVEKQPFVDEGGQIIRYFEDYTYYDYYATTQSTHLLSSSPAQIIAGGDMTIAGTVLNSDSQILAGGDLSVTGGSLTNFSTTGEQLVTYQGQRQFRDWEGNDEELDFYPWTPYSPAPERTEFNLATTAVESQSVNAGEQSTYSTDQIPFLSSSWFQQTTNTSENFFIETAPSFIDYRDWLSSDYMLEQMADDPSSTMKRLGGGFIEQRLVREQVAQLTGQRFLSSFSDDEAQFMALMDAGISFAKAHQLAPGVALSAEFVAMLTSDIVWLEHQKVELANGQTVTALVPKVYVKARPEDLIPSGGLLAGHKVGIRLENDLVNTGTIAGREVVQLNTDLLQHDGQIQGKKVRVNADNIDVNGGKIRGKESIELNAQQDIKIASVTSDTTNKEARSQFSRTNIKRVAGLYVTGDGGDLNIEAGRDMVISAADIQQTGEAGDIRLSVGEDLTFGTVRTAEANNSIHNAKDFNKHSEHKDIGTRISAKGDIRLGAGNNAKLVGANINSQEGEITFKARQVGIKNATASYVSDIASHTEYEGSFSSKSKDQRDRFGESTAIASILSGKAISIESNSDINITGSHLVAEQNLQLQAADNISVKSAEQRFEEEHYVNEEESGLLSNGGIGFTIGSQQLDVTDVSSQTRHLASEVGSLEGDVTISSGQKYLQQGSNVMAVQGDIDLTASKVDIENATEIYNRNQMTEFSQSGLSVSVNNYLLDLSNNVVRDIADTFESEDNSNKSLHALRAYAKGSQLKEQGVPIVAAVSEGDLGKAASSSGIKLSISLGSANTESSTIIESRTSRKSLIKANGKISMTSSDDITVIGSDIKAGKRIELDSEQNINLVASEQLERQRTSNESSSSSLGVSIGTNGLSLDLAASRGSGYANGDTVTHSNSHIEAGNTLAIRTGKDTNLRGAVASGERVLVEVGGDLSIESPQETAESKAKQKNTGMGVSIALGPGVNTLAISQSKQSNNSSYDSVSEQSAIFAGEVGFDIQVAGNTGLNGAVITSAAGEGMNQLITGTLTTKDIQNSMEGEASSTTNTVSRDMLNGKYAATKGIVNSLYNKGQSDISDSSFTRSAISPANIMISDEQKQQEITGKTVEETVAELNRDVNNAHQAVEKPDVGTLQTESLQEQLKNRLLLSTATAFTDESFRKIFLTKAKMYEVMRDENGDVLLDGDGHPLMRELTQDDKKELHDLEKSKLNIFTNGIFNDQAAAGRYAVQMTEALIGERAYLVYFPEASNGLSELLIAGYQKFMEGETFGISNATEEIIKLAEDHGGENLSLAGHSRGAMTIGNALEILRANYVSGDGLLEGTSIKLLGPAYNAQEAANLLAFLSDEKRTRVELENHADDFVGTAVGNNTSSYDTRPSDSSLIEEWIKIFGVAPTVHSCYGTGAASPNCRDFYGKSKHINVEAVNTK